MSLDIVRRIRGNVHGTVDVSATEDAVMGHWMVQRLRRIKQLAFLQFVFPGGSHSRFEHSLGVMQLAGMAWEKLAVNQRRLAETSLKWQDFATLEKSGVDGLVHGQLAPTFKNIEAIFGSDYVCQALRLAAFLHDVGHPPFSHSGERFLPSWTQVLEANQSAPEYLKNYMSQRIASLQKAGKDPKKVQVRHEIFTLLLLEDIMRDTYREHPNLKIKVSAQDIAAILTPDIPASPQSPLASLGVIPLCHELISGEIDVDRMDYLLRDSRECGVVYGIFDVSRIMDSLAVYADPKDGVLHLGIIFSGLAAFEDYLRARQSMYLQLYFHKTGVAGEAMLQHVARSLGGWSLPADPVAFAKVDEHNISDLLARAIGASKLTSAQKADLQEQLDDLLLRRRLWKRVFEVSFRNAAEANDSSMNRARGLVAELGVADELVSSANSLTRFRTRSEGELSANYLRLIKKDDRQFPRVMPIEDFSSLISASQSVFISRLYVPDRKNAAGKSIPSLVKDAIHKAFAKA